MSGANISSSSQSRDKIQQECFLKFPPKLLIMHRNFQFISSISRLSMLIMKLFFLLPETSRMTMMSQLRTDTSNSILQMKPESSECRKVMRPTQNSSLNVITLELLYCHFRAYSSKQKQKLRVLSLSYGLFQVTGRIAEENARNAALQFLQSTHKIGENRAKSQCLTSQFGALLKGCA